MIWKWHCGGRRKKVITAKNHSAFPHLLTNNWVKLLGSLIKTKILKYEYWKKQPWFENKLHGFHHSMKLESQWGHWEIKSLHSSKKTNLALTQNQMWAVVQRRGRVKKEEAIGGEWSKGAGGWGLETRRATEKRPVAQLSLFLQDNKRTIRWSIYNWTESPLCSGLTRAQFSSHVKTIMVHMSRQSLLASAGRNQQY